MGRVGAGGSPGAGADELFWLLPLLALALIPVLLVVLPGVPELRQDPGDGLGARVGVITAQRQPGGPTCLETHPSQSVGYALELIAERPWLGWGAAAFSVLYPIMRPRVGMAIPTISHWSWRSAMAFR